MKVYSFDNCLNLCTGAHRVLVDIHQAIRERFDAKIVGTFNYNEVNKSLEIPENDYLKLKSIFQLKNSVVIVHQRRLAMIFCTMNTLFHLNIDVVYVHHSVLSGMKRLSFFPKQIITISDRCIANLTDYFNVPSSYITKIYNAVPDEYKAEHKKSKDGKIRILYPATVYPVKRQIEVVQHLKATLPESVLIQFAGDGEDMKELQEITKGDHRFECLGFINNVRERLANSDYCMLFSQYEGLPISLIEATMMGVPIICNDVGGNTEIAIDGKNAFVRSTWEDLSACIISLNNISDESYAAMSKFSRKHYEDNFTVETFQNKYIKYLESIQNGKN